MPLRKAALVTLAVCALTGAALAQPKPKEECALQNGQYAETQFCVSSTLAPQGEDKRGPEIILDTETGKVWCEGVTGYGIG